MRGKPYDNCAVLEFVNLDVLERAEHVTRLYVAIEAVNDQPVLMGLNTSSAVLDNYLPPEINNGFNISFLVTEHEVRHKTQSCNMYSTLIVSCTGDGC